MSSMNGQWGVLRRSTGKVERYRCEDDAVAASLMRYDVGLLITGAVVVVCRIGGRWVDQDEAHRRGAK